MKSFEVWTDPSNSNVTKPIHVLEADKLNFSNGVYYFYSAASDILHLIIATPGMLVRTSKDR
jgi:hypothetical protein